MENKAKKAEGVRAWYERTTRKSRRTFIIATACTVTLMFLMWTLAPMSTLKRIQEFNGALTLPLFGGLWLYMFIFMFLVPSREASFRGQEALEEGIEFLRGAAEVWKKVGTDVEREIPLLRQKVDEAMSEVKKASKSLEDALAKNSSLMDDARPVLQSLKEIEERLDKEIKTGIVEDLRLAIDAVKTMMPPPGANPMKSGQKPAAAEGDLGGALAAIRKKKSTEPGSAQVKV
jgi:hypothetical protein